MENNDEDVQKEINRIRDEIIEKYFPTLSDKTKTVVAMAMDDYVVRLAAEIKSDEKYITELKKENLDLGEEIEKDREDESATKL